jgi:hypothetical protein
MTRKNYWVSLGHTTCDNSSKYLFFFSGLALTSLLTVPSKVVYDNFANILYRIGSSLIQIMKDYDGEGVKTE